MDPFEKSKSPKPFVNRRKRGEDVWSRVLRYIGIVIYPILFINLAFLMSATGTQRKEKALVGMVKSVNFDDSWGVASEEDRQDMQALFGPTSVHRARNWVNMNVFLPIMICGLLIGLAGLAIDRRRTRRRHDYSRKSPLFFTIISLIGVAIYCIFF